MTDRELLEAAAKAAGIVNLRWGIDEPELQITGKGQFVGATWNPLTSDGDALRLAVKLGMNIDIGSRPVEFTEASVIRDDMRIGAEEYHEGDPYAATRRAVVRAAAAIGKETT